MREADAASATSDGTATSVTAGARLASEVAAGADFTAIRYAQCWEDADVLLAALDVRPGDTCLSIASAGDNTLSLLARAPARVIAVDLSPAQLACLELRVAAYRTLEHAELLELIGSRPSRQRERLYARCRLALAPAARSFWDARPQAIAAGIGSAGKFERYFALFRHRVLPFVHSRADVTSLLAGGPVDERRAFYARTWDSWRWRLLFRLFFSRFVMARAGRDPRFFQYVEGSVAERLLTRTCYALTELDPAANPYVHWILTGTHGAALPFALRPENFAPIRANLDRLEWHCQSVEALLAETPAGSIDRFNLSDIFEYVSAGSYHALLTRLIAAGRLRARLAYWNMLVPRHRPATLAARLRPLEDESRRLHQADKAFFYSDFVVEEVC
jgi:S-adenosylmethionine-diacylglycerol 3-amino-3-carboxypropyl transferase